MKEIGFRFLLFGKEIGTLPSSGGKPTHFEFWFEKLAGEMN